jgi:hypothetical protein
VASEHGAPQAPQLVLSFNVLTHTALAPLPQSFGKLVVHV